VLSLEVSVLQHASWMCICSTGVWHPVLPLDLSVTKQSVLPLVLDVSVHAFAVPGGVWLTPACVAPGPVHEGPVILTKFHNFDARHKILEGQ
jgi:hypothetical protein